MRKYLVALVLLFYFVGLRVYYDPYREMVRVRKSGTGLALMTALELAGTDSWQINFGFLDQASRVDIIGSGGFPNFNSLTVWTSPLTAHAMWGDDLQAKRSELERISLHASPDFFTTIQWLDDRPHTGNLALTLIATRTQTISHEDIHLGWQNEDRVSRLDTFKNIVLTTQIYNKDNFWLIMNRVEPTEGNDEISQYISRSENSIMTQIRQYDRSNIDQRLLWRALYTLPGDVSARAAGGSTGRALRAFVFTVLPTIPVMVIMFLPMLFVPTAHLGWVSVVYLFFLVALGVAPILYWVWKSARSTHTTAT